jgi:hypothetical protein
MENVLHVWTQWDRASDMPTLEALAARAVVLALALGCAGLTSAGCAAPDGSGRTPPAARTVERDTPPEETGDAARVVDGTFLRPNVHGDDGAEGYMHVTPADMPWVVSIGYPRRPPKYGGRRDARRVAVEGMQMWEQAIQPHLPWFRLEFVEDDPSAPVQVEWKRRITGPWAGFGGFAWKVDDSGLRVTGHMEVSTTPSNFSTLEIDELSVLFTHEFGHVLGLGHCLDCDSAMNYAWNTRDRVFVTDLDVRTFLALLEQPNAVGGFTTAASVSSSDGSTD